ncbi:hypothetical protein DFQ28_000051 [Apophysomyces sp. BC1034]|nr:hypothetical protein DFQ30_007792 [Apophysomyces sp. BC1015]KAG0182838.1 hypothetical protein DFQ29_001778 [Apophysomyces sp. BC1021]KAG0194952.1 hypothetical protein DFQ28_000051 [Apophysomyces sp. BC1034]
MYFFNLFITWCLFISVTYAWTTQIEPSLVEDWPLTVNIRDTIEGYYENIVDEVLSTNSEVFLLDLTHMRSIQSGRLRLEASQLGLKNVNDDCLFKMPGIIAQNVHQLNEQVFGSIDGLVSTYLPLLLPRQLSTLDDRRLDELLQSINQAMVFELIQKMQNYELSSRIIHEMKLCQTGAVTDNKFASQVQRWLAFAGPKSIVPKGTSAVDRFSQTTRLHLTSALHARLSDLQSLISEDLRDEFNI